MNVSNSTGNETFVWTSLYSILLVWSLVGNVLVIAVVYCNSNLRTNMNYLIVNMAVSDLLVPLGAMPFHILWKTRNFELGDYPFGKALCKLFPFLVELPLFVSSISLVIIAFQRFIAVVYPTRRQISSRKTRWIVISFPWIIAIAMFSPNLYSYRLTNENGYTKCIISWSPAFEHWTGEVVFVSTATLVGLVVPLTLIIIMYSIVVYKLSKNLASVRDMVEKESIRSRQRRNRRIFSMLMSIVVMFTICWCPVFTIVLLNLVAPSFLSINSYSSNAMYTIFSYMWYLFAAINPCIYFVFLKDFRQGLKRLCCRKTTSANEAIPRRPRPHGGE